MFAVRRADKRREHTDFIEKTKSGTKCSAFADTGIVCSDSAL
jgi:hypothetical protein